MDFNDIYKDIVKSSATSYFHGKVVYDEVGNITDAIVLDNNESFKQKVRLKTEYINNKSLRTMLAHSEFNWIDMITKGMKENGFCEDCYIDDFYHMFDIKFAKINDDEFYITFREIQTCKKYVNNNKELPESTVWYRDKYGRFITEEKLKYDLAYENDVKLDEILNAINDTIILLNRDKILYVNEAFEKMFGLKNYELFENPNILYNLFDDEYKEKIGDYMYDKTYDIEIKVNTKDNIKKWIRYKDYHIDGKVVDREKMTIISDITEKKEAEIEIERLRMEFFSNITHELKTPLNLIFSSLQLIELKSNQNNKENTNNNICDINKEFNEEKYIKIIRQNALRLLRLVNNLIDTTKIDTKYLDLVYENEDIVNFAEKVFNSIDEYSASKNIELIFDTNIEEKIIAFDMDKMERIILNLLSNAIKFNKKDGKIYLDINNKDNFVEITVKDTGIGIPKDKIENVFDRFVQVNNRMTKISEGSGIGLSLTKSLVEMHGGTIDIKSTYKEGTEVTIKIPNRIINEEKYDDKISKKLSAEYNSFVKKLEIEFSDIY